MHFGTVNTQGRVCNSLFNTCITKLKWLMNSVFKFMDAKAFMNCSSMFFSLYFHTIYSTLYNDGKYINGDQLLMPRTFNIANATTPACSESEFDLLMYRLNICEYCKCLPTPKTMFFKVVAKFFPLSFSMAL